MSTPQECTKNYLNLKQNKSKIFIRYTFYCVDNLNIYFLFNHCIILLIDFPFILRV